MDIRKIKLNKNQNIFFTSDLHFNHSNVIKWCNRPFLNVEEMNQSLIDNWNKKVSNKDIVFHLGDLFWKYYNDKQILDALNGERIYLIPGNHDSKTYNSVKYISCSFKNSSRRLERT